MTNYGLYTAFVAAAITSGCSSSHHVCRSDADTPTDARDEPQPNVPGTPIPWDLDVSFQGRRHIEAGNAELSWQIVHGLPRDYQLDVLPLIGVHQGVSPETIELRLLRDGAVVRAWLRVAWPPDLPRSASVGVGLRFVRSDFPSGDYDVWDEPLRLIRLDSTGDTETVHYDGSVVIRQVLAPPVPTLGEAWVVEAGLGYQLRYAIVNQSGTSRSISIGVHGSARGRVDVEGGVERVVDIAPGEDIEVTAILSVDEPGACLPCMSVTVTDMSAPEQPVDQIAVYAIAR